MSSNFGESVLGAVTICLAEGGAVFGLVDCNSFYCSCERLFRPELRTRPVVVLSNNDGCVISRSKEAKAIGIKMGEPAFLRRDYFAANNIEVFSSNYALYGDLSRRVMNQLRNFSPEVEVYSIDEAFLGFSGFPKEQLPAIANNIYKKIPKNVGIPVSVGIGRTKTLAKLANHLAKKKEEYGGICIIDSESAREAALKQVAVADIWGIGPAYSRKLEAVGITTAWEFSRTNKHWIRKHLTVVGARIAYELNSIECSTLVTVDPAKKSIAVARSFSSMKDTKEALEGAVATFATAAAHNLRKQKGYANLIRVFVHTNEHRPDLEQYVCNIVVPLPVQMQDTIKIVRYALHGLRKIYKRGLQYKKAGVILDQIRLESDQQNDLFGDFNRDRDERISIAMDKINERYGRHKVKLAVASKQNAWTLRQESRSPRYTTRWGELPVVLS
ncbi:Y-family DNA polymerase [Leptospira kmetyi]|uniref:ImpB/MucB/SamB family protein n=1 Tax=Leptospira kmetyi TaxID=408139 RepID=A0ABX4N6V2_9LEPT|nr:ImpB/MucB/SamB family protein [Leptospira kmetyi]PJZ39711.1 ImpB/MucB/SamB family protein [Leptospira kmetyi]